MTKKAILLLENGLCYDGSAFGHEGESTGEVVFNTSHTGYQEILTDPSYKGQIVTMTYPHIGNYGINSEDFESTKPHLAGFVISEYSKIYSNWRAQKSLAEFLKENKIVAIAGVDTRSIVKKIRDKGSMKGIISTIDFDKKSLRNKLNSAPGIVGKDLVKEVTCKEVQRFKSLKIQKPKSPTIQRQPYKVVVMDFGVKLVILESLVSVNIEPLVVPANTEFKQLLEFKPDGVLLSNGPGDPAAVPYVIATVKKLLSHPLPLFGICLGHQLIGLASGAKTYKLKFGHHGSNQPIKNLKTSRVEITAENHNFAIDEETLSDFRVTHRNLNDGTVEGMEHKKLPIFSVQFHPEASPGPHDAKYLFEKFAMMIAKKSF